MATNRLPNIDGGIQPTLLTTTGDIMYASSANTPARLAVGSAGKVLTVSSGIPSWATLTAGGMTLLQSMALSGSSTTSSTFTASDYINYLIILSEANASTGVNISMRLNADSGSNYYRVGAQSSGPAYVIEGEGTQAQTSLKVSFAGTSTAAGLKAFGRININRINDTSGVSITSECYSPISNVDYRGNWTAAVYQNTAVITSITLLPSSGTWSGGTAYIYGVK